MLIIKVLEMGGHKVPYTLPPNELFEAAERNEKIKRKEQRQKRRPSREKPKKGEPMENAVVADFLPPVDEDNHVIIM